MRGLLDVISGPSGVGKGTICEVLCRRDDRISLSVSATTRAPRAGEVDGVQYYFTTRERFREMIAGGELLEWAEVYGDYYGTPSAPVADLLEQGRDVILEIDVQGALQVKERAPEAILIFVRPPSLTELESRLRGRAKDSEEQIVRRLEWARTELQAVSKYDYVILNDHVEDAVCKVEAIMVAEKCRPVYLTGLEAIT